MRQWIASLWVSLSLVGCYDVGTGSTGARTCEQLGWVCGVDGFGASCGSCAAPQTCSLGSCVEPGAQVIASGATAYALAGGYAGTLFTLPAPALVRYSASSAGLFQLGVFTVSDWTLFASGQPSGAFILSNATPSITDGVRLAAGTYTLGFRCANAVDACTIRYSVNATY
jgi:hypothetical protein